MDQKFYHISILPEACLDALRISPNGVYVDATLGGAGHSLRIASRLTTGRLICIDAMAKPFKMRTRALPLYGIA